MTELISPSTGLYQIGKANVYFTKDGGTRRHVGNVSAASIQIETDKLDHFSAMEGIKKKDFSATLSSTCTVKLTLEEISAPNLALALLGDTEATDSDTEGGGNKAFNIGAVESTTGRLEIIGSNDVGPKWTYDLFAVTITPDDAVELIGDDFAGLAVTGDCLAQDVGGSKTAYGKAILQGSAA